MTFDFIISYVLELIPWILFWEFSKWVVRGLIKNWKAESEMLITKKQIDE